MIQCENTKEIEKQIQKIKLLSDEYDQKIIKYLTNQTGGNIHDLIISNKPHSCNRKKISIYIYTCFVYFNNKNLF